MPGLTFGPTTSWSLELADHVSAMAVSPDGRRIAIGSLAGEVVVVDAADGSVEAKLPDHPLGVLDVAWSADGATIATGGQDGMLRVCDARGATVTEHDLGAWVLQVTWSPRGTLAAAAGKVLSVVAGDELRSALPVSSTISALAWSDNGTRVGVASYGGISWFDVDRARLDLPARRHDFKGSPLALALAPTGKWACAGYQDSSIHLWRLWSGDELTMSGYPAKIELLGFRSDGRWLASACLGELTWWDFGGKGPKGTAPAVGTAHTSRVTWLAWQPDGSALASGDPSGAVLLWPSPTSSRQDVAPSDVLDGTSAVAASSWTPDGTGVVVGRHDGTVSMHRVR